MKNSTRCIYQIKVTLKHIRPPLWRRFLVPSTMKLPDFHRTLQVVMGWENYHLHQFRIGNRNFAIPDPEWDDKTVLDERRFQIAQVFKAEKDILLYEYDFGDGWEHQVVLEKILPYDNDATMPRCVAGKRACPPEDVGGPRGYEKFLEATSDSGHPEHEEMLQWINGRFDAENFDVDSVNQRLHEELC